MTSPDLSNVEIFASSGQSIYRRVVGSSGTATWRPILDASTLDKLSDLDCSSSADKVHIVASGVNPSGSYMHATGSVSNTAYNSFIRELSTNNPSTFTYVGVSIAAWTNSTDVRYQMAAVSGSSTIVPPTWIVTDGTTSSSYTPTVEYALTSAPDLALQEGPGDNPHHEELVAFTGGGMVYFDHEWGYGSSWFDNTYWPPPSSKTYSYSPTLCNHSDSTTSDYRRHIAAVASGRLYYAYSEPDWSNGPTFSTWELTGNDIPASAPDCVVTSDNTVHIVYLTQTGTIAHVYRKGISGPWNPEDLGAF